MISKQQRNDKHKQTFNGNITHSECSQLHVKHAQSQLGIPQLGEQASE